MITTSDANQGGGETYRVGVTGHHKTRRGFLRPCTPHHNANVAMLNAKKTANAAMRCDVIRDANPDNRFCGCVGNDSNLLIVFYVQIMPDDFVMQLHRF